MNCVPSMKMVAIELVFHFSAIMKLRKFTFIILTNIEVVIQLLVKYFCRNKHYIALND